MMAKPVKTLELHYNHWSSFDKESELFKIIKYRHLAVLDTQH